MILSDSKAQFRPRNFSYVIGTAEQRGGMLVRRRRRVTLGAAPAGNLANYR